MAETMICKQPRLSSWYGVWVMAAGARPWGATRRAGLIAMLALTDAGAQAGRDSLLIARAQLASAATVDSLLPAMEFGRWLATLRPAVRIDWEVNDCGEGGDGRKAPTCVEAVLHISRDTSARVSLAVADESGHLSSAAYFMGVVTVHDSTEFFKTLHEWAGSVRRRPRRTPLDGQVANACMNELVRTNIQYEQRRSGCPRAHFDRLPTPRLYV